MRTVDTVTVTAAEFHRNIGVYQAIALTEPVTMFALGKSLRVLG